MFVMLYLNDIKNKIRATKIARIHSFNLNILRTSHFQLEFIKMKEEKNSAL